QGPDGVIECTVKTRYRQHDIPCRITPKANGELQVDFASPQKAVTPGQSAVFYLNEQCLGGGIIDKALN
ncbi:MAG: tRNA 2-thiouridine(34) synthase MnmA, partial [Alkalimonas sp.]|nr:tRNA 2-thiouridine(34) synthase MnmA [Alkalimonas sp.]